MYLENVIGFINGAVISIDRPSGQYSNLHKVYNGHKSKHTLNYQIITTPDRLCAHLYGPEVGRWHDVFLYSESKVDSFLPHLLIINCQQYMLYGDSGYSRRAYYAIPFVDDNLMIWEAAFSTAMSKSRITVEWLFKEVMMLWAFVECMSHLKVLQMSAGLNLQADTILSDFENCVEPMRSTHISKAGHQLWSSTYVFVAVKRGMGTQPPAERPGRTHSRVSIA